MSTTLGKESLLRQRMKDASVKGDYILAGRLQKEIRELQGVELLALRQQITNLKAQIREAADRQDYITAGKLQIDLQNLQERQQQVGLYEFVRELREVVEENFLYFWNFAGVRGFFWLLIFNILFAWAFHA